MKKFLLLLLFTTSLFGTQLSAQDYTNRDNLRLLKTKNFSLIMKGRNSMQSDNVYLLSPLNATTGVTICPLLNWSDATYFDTYEIILSTDAAFTNVVVHDSDITYSYYDINLDCNTKYYWKVRCKEGTNYGEWSEAFSFTTVSGTKAKQKLLGITAKFEGIPYTGANVTMPVTVELRSGSTLLSSSLVTKKSAIIDSTSYTEIDFSGTAHGSYWLVVRSAGYFPLGSTEKIELSENQKATYDFTLSTTKVSGAGEAVISKGNKYFVRFGDLNADRIINASDIDLFKSVSGVKNDKYVPKNK